MLIFTPADIKEMDERVALLRRAVSLIHNDVDGLIQDAAKDDSLATHLFLSRMEGTLDALTASLDQLIHASYEIRNYQKWHNAAFREMYPDQWEDLHKPE